MELAFELTHRIEILRGARVFVCGTGVATHGRCREVGYAAGGNEILLIGVDFGADDAIHRPGIFQRELEIPREATPACRGEKERSPVASSELSENGTKVGGEILNVLGLSTTAPGT